MNGLVVRLREGCVISLETDEWFGKVDERSTDELLAEAANALEVADSERKNLAMLVVRLSRRAPFGDPVVEQAMDYLKRKEMLGSILREASAVQTEHKEDK